MKNGRMQAKDIDDRAVLQFVHDMEKRENRWTFSFDLRDHFKLDLELVCAKADALIRRGLMTGCSCGCRGDFELTEAGEDFLRAGST